MNIGNNEITKVYKGNTEISKIYLGDNLVFGGAIPPFNPEAGLTLTQTFPSGNLIAFNFNRGQSSVFAFDVTGLDGSSGGLIFELGGSAIGCYLGFRSNGDLIWRTGDGGTPWDAQTSYILIPAVDAPSGDGTFVFQVEMGATQNLKIWWNGIEIGTPVNQSTESDWAGAGDGDYFNTETTGIPDGEVNTALAPTTFSDLRYYQNQIVS